MKKGFISVPIILAIALIGSLGFYTVKTIDTNKKIAVYETKLEELSNLGANNAVGGKKYYLSGSGVSSSQATIGLTKFEIAGGTQKIRMTDFGALGCGTIQPGNSTKQEFISFTGVTQNSDSTATLTGVTRGLSPIPDYTASTTLQTAHAGNSSFVISNSPPCFYEGYANITQNEAVTGVWTFNTNLPTSSLTSTTSSQFTVKSYVDNTVNAGAATSTETNGGIVELGTLAEQSSGYNGGATQPTVLQTKNSTSSPDVRGSYNIIAQATGYLKQTWLDLTEAFTWTGVHIFSGSPFTISGATTTISSATTTLTDTNAILGIGTSTPTLTASGVSIASDTYIAGGLGVGSATTTDGNLVVAGLASTTNLVVSGIQTGGSMTYTASSTIFTGGTVTYTGSIPTNANWGMIKFTIDDSSTAGTTNGTAMIARSGLTSAVVGWSTNAGDEGVYTLAFSGSDFVVTETTDDGSDSTITGTAYWYQ